MSLVATRVGLIHRLATQRDTGGDDAGGGSSPIWADQLVDQPCRAWTDVTKQIVNGVSVVVTDARISVPVGTDVRETDRVLSVIDRVGDSVLPGPLRIQAIASFSDHLELLVQQER